MIKSLKMVARKRVRLQYPGEEGDGGDAFAGGEVG